MNSKFIKVILNIVKKLSNLEIDYIFVGSTSLALQNIPIIPHDIDIATNYQGIELIQSQFSEFVKTPLEKRLSKINLKFGIKVYANFLTLEIEGIKVEVISDLVIKNIPLKYSLNDLVKIKIDNNSIPCLSINKVCNAYLLAENFKKVKLIEKYISKRHG